MFILNIIILNSFSVYAQQSRVIQGIVTSAENQVTLEGVSVVKSGTSVGTITDSDGKYKINSSDGDTLAFSFLGYITQRIAVNAQSMINVALVSSGTTELQQVVVVGFGVQKKITVTGSIMSVSTKDLVVSPNASVANTLGGRITGLSTVQYSGQPGGDDPNIFLRGIGSLTTAASSPLILVDGVERPFTQLDPNEIESITVLKDASATAVFGVRGANGVIIVTTKRGVEGKPKISFSASAGFQKPLRLPEFVDSYTHAVLYDLSETNDDPNAVLRFSPIAIEAFRTNSDPIIYPNTDWIKYILKPAGFQTQENINISGGTKAVRYFVSAGYLKQDGLFRTFDLNGNYTYDRYNYRANLDMDVTKTTKISLTTGGRSEVRNQPLNAEPQFSIWRNIYFSQPYRGIGIVNGKHIMSDPRYIPGETRDALNGYYGLGFLNGRDNILNLDLELRQQLNFVTKGLLFRIKGSYNSTYSLDKNRASSKATYFANYLHDLDPSAPDDKTVVYRKSGEDGILGYSESTAKARNWYMEAAFEYQRDYGKHHVTGLLLYNESKYYYPAVNVDIPRGYVGLVGRVTYDYNNKYLLDLNMGYNGSENFAPGKRFGLFPAISAGWILTDENFMKNISFVDFLKFRASYGIVGNDIMGSNRFLYLPGSYNANDPSWHYSFGTDNPTYALGASEGRIGNPDVGWEKAKKQNFGVDLRLFKDRLSLTADVFFEHRTNILTTRKTVPGIASLNLPAVNIGIVDNHGYELQLKWQDKIGNFGYSLSPTFSFARNKIIFQDEVHQNYDYLYATGHPVGQPFTYVFDGFWSTADALKYKDFPSSGYIPHGGDLRYKDLNGDGLINVDDRQAMGYPDWPEYTAGLNIQANYKGFEIYILWTGATHVSRRFSGSFQQPFGPTHGFGLMKFMADGAWTEKTAATATFPRMTFAGIGNNIKPSDFWLRDASYIRLKTLEFGYNFKIGSALKRVGVSNLRVYTNGYNLITIDRIKLIDPEAVPTEGAQYPLMQIFNFGINVVF